MPRQSRYLHTRLGRVRAYYGFTQTELADYLGISPALANQLEAGRRALSAEVLARLQPLLDALPEPAAGPPLPLAPPPGVLAPAPLEKRRAACLHAAHNLRWEMRQLPEKAQLAARWARALPALQASVPPLAALPPEADVPTRREAIRLAYVRDWLATQATALDPEVLSQWHLLHLRAEALEAEAAALAVLLARSS